MDDETTVVGAVFIVIASLLFVLGLKGCNNDRASTSERHYIVGECIKVGHTTLECKELP